MKWHLTIGLLACATSLSAQLPGDTARLRDLQVTATKVARREGATPAATTIIRGEDLRARGIHFVVDALREVPGMAIAQSGSDGAVTSVFLRGGESNYTKILLDGVPLNQPGGSIDLAHLTTDDLDRIEIVRGASSVLYGADAMSGVIQLFTRRGELRSGELTANGGSWGSNDAVAHLEVPGPVSLSVTGTRVASNGFYQFNDAYRNSVGTAHLDAALGQRTDASLVVRYGDALKHFPTNSAGVAVDHNQYSTERDLAISASATRQMTDRLTIHVLGYLSRTNQGFVNRPDSPADSTGFGFVEDRSTVTWRKGVDLRADLSVHHAVIISTGIGAERESDDEFDAAAFNFGTGVGMDTTALAGARSTTDVYAQFLSDAARAISVTAGARFDRNSVFGDFGTWRVGINWRLPNSMRIWSSAGTAFKAPTFSQLMAHSAFEVGNPALAPERSRNQELGVEAGDRLLVGITAFWQQFADLIQYLSASPNQPTYTNLGAARVRGAEFTARASVSRSITATAQWTLLHSEVTDTGVVSSPVFALGRRLLRRPSSSGAITGEFRHGRVNAALTVTHVGSRDDVDFSPSDSPNAERVILSEYTTVDLSTQFTAWQRPHHQVDLLLRVQNLFDAFDQQVFGYKPRGRAWFAGGRIRF